MIVIDPRFVQSGLYPLKDHQIILFRDTDEAHHHHWHTGYGTGGGDSP